MAGRQGFEPRYAAPEAAVLPLDDLPAGGNNIILTLPFDQNARRGNDGQHTVERHRGLAGPGVIAVEAIEEVVGVIAEIDHFATERDFPFLVCPGFGDTKICALVD